MLLHIMGYDTAILNALVTAFDGTGNAALHAGGGVVPLAAAR